MRHLRMLGLTLIAALALAGLGGGATASAATLCNVPVNPCPAVNIVPAPFTIDGVAPAPVTFSMGGFTVTCTGSSFNDKILNNPGVPIADLIQSWTFTGCTLAPGGVPCSVTPIGGSPLNWPTRISTPSTTPGGDGDFAVDQFGVTITCKGFAPCSEVGAKPNQNITGPWYNPTTASPPKPIPSPHSVVGFNAPITGGPAPCGPGGFAANYEVTQSPFPGADLWLV